MAVTAVTKAAEIPDPYKVAKFTASQTVAGAAVTTSTPMAKVAPKLQGKAATSSGSTAAVKTAVHSVVQPVAKKTVTVSSGAARTEIAKVTKTTIRTTPFNAPLVRPLEIVQEIQVRAEVAGLPDNLIAESIYVTETLFDATDDFDRMSTLLLEPPVADAAIADLRIALADIASDAIAADTAAEADDDSVDKSNRKSASSSEDSLIPELAWESVVLDPLEEGEL
jgi:hypothetical protein